jgi:L-ascorbate metabolism protein UlaG (beta-lactamase superfamily)
VFSRIEPFLADCELLFDIARPTGSLRLWWMGQSGFLIQWQGRHLLMDPYLSDLLAEKYAGTDLPHTRMTRRPVAPEKLTFIDVLTASHAHTDHLDPNTVGPVLHASPRARFIVPASAYEIAMKRGQRSGERIDTLETGSSIEVCGFRITAIPSAHEELETDELGRHRFLGYIVQMGPWTIYHSGDTVLYDGLAERLKFYRVDVALLPINGRCGRVAGNLNENEAAWLGKAMGAQLVIPCHYDMFAFNTGNVEDFVNAAKKLQQPYTVLRCGEPWSSDSPSG